MKNADGNSGVTNVNQMCDTNKQSKQKRQPQEEWKNRNDFYETFFFTHKKIKELDY